MHPVPRAHNSDPSAVLRLVTERAQQLTRGTGAALALGHKRAMVCRASVGNAPRLGCQLDVSTGFSGECIRTGKAIRCDDSSRDPRVDAEICRRLGIHSILAAPIPFEGEIVGLLEVFSSQRFAFHDGDLAVVESLAETALPAPSSPKTRPAPNLLIKQESAYRVFVENLIDMVRPPRTAPLKLTSRPARFWPDVFVPSPLPWERFVQSMLLHVMTVATLFGILQFGISRPRLLPRDQLSFHKSDVIYYLPSEYVSLIKKENGSLLSRHTLTYFKQPALSVRRESHSPARRSIEPPELHPKQDSRLLGLMARNPALPPVPLSATMRQRLTTPAAKVSAVAPPPDISAIARAQHLTPEPPLVIKPAPSVHLSIRQVASLSIGQLQAVGPAPQLPIYQSGARLDIAERTLGSRQPAVVPPAPTVRGLGATAQRISSLSNGAMQVAPPAPVLQLAGDYLRSTPDGKVVVVVPPPPSVRGLDRSGAQYSSSLPAGSMQVVPPAPLLQLAGGYLRSTPDGKVVVVVPPPPSVRGLDRSGDPYSSSLPAGGMQVVPPAPLLTATSTYAGRSVNGIVTPAVPPAPSVDRLGYPGGQRVNSVRAGDLQLSAPPVTVQINASRGRSGVPIAMASGLPGGLLPGEMITSGPENFPDAEDFPEAKQLNVNFIGPALVLPASSYFLSYEVFIAEERLTRHQSRLIKLVYDFLPYQPRLSDYGPNYPAIENLHATRDPSCDETLMQVETSAKAVRWSQADRAQLSAKSAKQRQSSLPCYRTTADEFRRARARLHP